MRSVPGSGRTRLWSFRHPEEADALERGESLYAAPGRIDPWFVAAYDWMSMRLAERVPPPEGVTYPVWGWYRADGMRRPRPDLRARWGEPGQPMALVEYVVPDADVLLSDFDAWHYVLNSWPLPVDPVDAARWEGVVGNRGWPRGGPLPPDVARDVEATWVRIFDLGEHHPDFRDPPDRMRVQGVTWSIRPDDVVSVRRFRSR